MSKNHNKVIARLEGSSRKSKLAKLVVLKNTNRMRTAVGGFKSMSYDKERLSVKDCGWGL